MRKDEEDEEEEVVGKEELYHGLIEEGKEGGG